MYLLQRLILAFSLFLAGLAPVSAQKIFFGTYDKRSEKAYQEGIKQTQARNFQKAIAHFQEAIARDSSYGAPYVQAASLFRILQQPEQTYLYYALGLPKVKEGTTYLADYMTFADLNFERGQYQQALPYYQMYLRLAGKNSRYSRHALQQLNNLEFIHQAIANPVLFNPVPMEAGINQFALQYSPVLTADQRSLLFTARRGSGPLDDEDLYLATQKDGVWQAPVSVSGNINTPLNEGAASLSGDGRVIVFTACNLPDSYGGCDLYISFKAGGTWSKPRNMGKNVNSAAWDSQPSLSADGRTLYFASNRKGGLGMEDLYVTRYQINNTWSIPENLGKTINTAGRENSPFLHASGNTFYFATDGLDGMGGLDLFMASREGKTWGTPKNMGYPLNTHRDESSIFISPDNVLGYYSSQQPPGSKVEVALVQFTVPDVWKGKTTSSFAQGNVYSSKTKEPLQAQVQVYDLDSVSLLSQQVSSDAASGEYTIVVNQAQRYALYVSAPGHVLESRYISSAAKAKPLALDFYLQPLAKGSKAVLSNLFFDTGKAVLRPESRTELDKLQQFFKANPSLKVEIAGHTDNVGSSSANLKLSQERANAVVSYLVSKGIARTVFKAQGYGDSQPAVANTTEENRQLNRRIELRVL